MQSGDFRGRLTNPRVQSIATDLFQEPQMNILQINSSARRLQDDQGSVSTRLANEMSAGLRAANPGATLTVRDFAANPLPVLDEAALGALFTPA